MKGFQLTSTNEFWVDIKGYDGLYLISSLGSVKSLDRVVYQKNAHNSYSKRVYKGKALKFRESKNGYLYCHLSVNGAHKTVKPHRLVAEHFIENNESKPEVNHIDGNKLNNNKENLEWVTSSENKIHALNLGLKKNPAGKESHGFKGVVIGENVDSGDVIYLYGAKDIIEKGFTPSGVSSVVLGNQRTHRNFKFRRESDTNE